MRGLGAPQFFRVPSSDDKKIKDFGEEKGWGASRVDLPYLVSNILDTPHSTRPGLACVMPHGWGTSGSDNEGPTLRLIFFPLKPKDQIFFKKIIKDSFFLTNL